MDKDTKKIILKRVKSVPSSIVKQPLPVATQVTMASHDRQEPQNLQVMQMEHPCGTSTPIQKDGHAGSSSKAMTLIPSSPHNYSKSPLSSSHQLNPQHITEQNSYRHVVIPPSSKQNKRFTNNISSSSPLPAHANKKQKVTILSNVLLPSPQTLRAKRIYSLACQSSTSTTNFPSSSPNIHNTKEVELNRTKIVPQLLTSLSSSSRFLLNQKAVSSNNSLQLNSSMSPQTMRAHTIFNLGNSSSAGQVTIVPRNAASLNTTNHSQQISSNPVVSSSTESSSLSKFQLEVLLKKKEDQIKNLQRLNKNKTMQLNRKEKVIETLQQELDQSIDAILEKHLEDPFLSVVKDHIKNKSKPPQAHRFTNETKHFSQVIHFMSPKVLKILRLQFHICLPSESTISRLSCNWDFTNGFNPSLLHPLQMATKDLNGKEKVVILTLDEMAIDTTIAYDKKNDKVLGLDSRCEKGFKMSKQALVFMVSFIFKICFSFP